MPTFICTGEITPFTSSRTENARDQLDSDVAMDENNQINVAAHNIEGVLLI